jgi:hypothetical protein
LAADRSPARAYGRSRRAPAFRPLQKRRRTCAIDDSADDDYVDSLVLAAEQYFDGFSGVLGRRRKSNVAHRKAQGVRHRHAQPAPTTSATSSQTFAELVEIAIADGTGANQANNVFSDERTLGLDAPRTSISPGRLTNALGATLAFTAVKAILIVADAATPTTSSSAEPLRTGFVGPFADATDKINIGPGDVFLITRRSAAGWPSPPAPATSSRSPTAAQARRSPTRSSSSAKRNAAARGRRSPPQDHHPASDGSQNQHRRLPNRLGRLCRPSRAEVTALDGREVVMDQVLQGISTYRVRIRWRGDLTTEDQLRSPDGCFGYDAKGGARPQHPLGRRSGRPPASC